LLAASLALVRPASAQKSADTLRAVFRDAVTNVDPYYNQLRSGLIIAHHAWDCLLYRDPETFQVKPLLATNWTVVDERTIDFTLRQNVKFHNGDRFTADDVVYTFNLVSASDSRISTPGTRTGLRRRKKPATSPCA
jgi:peptide/nickel transport system substrate-binding protein